MKTFDAQKKAEEAGHDLVEVAPAANPPVCRIMDYGKYKYELSKKQHQAKGHSRASQVKEVKFRPFTDKHDFEFKVNHIIRFLAQGHKTKVTLMFRGREMSRRDLGTGIMEKIRLAIDQHATIEQNPRMEGNCMIMICAPKSAG